MLRVVQWATGNVGREAVAAVHAHRELTVVGALVYDERKAGRDVGEVCGIGPIGVTATADRDAILGVDADCALYMAQGEMDPTGALDDICALLPSGKNVVSTALTSLIYPKSAGDEVVAALEAACAAGGTSFHGTGIEPGWAGEVFPLTMSTSPGSAPTRPPTGRPAGAGASRSRASRRCVLDATIAVHARTTPAGASGPPCTRSTPSPPCAPPSRASARSSTCR